MSLRFFSVPSSECEKSYCCKVLELMSLRTNVRSLKHERAWNQCHFVSACHFERMREVLNGHCLETIVTSNACEKSYCCKELG